MVNIIKNRPRKYQKIKDIHSFIKKLKFHEGFYMRTIDTGCHGYILKKEKVGKYIRIYYRTKINHWQNNPKINKVISYRIMFIKNPLEDFNKYTGKEIKTK